VNQNNKFIYTTSIILFIFWWLVQPHALIIAASLAFATFIILEFLNSLGKRINIQELIMLMLSLNYLIFPYFTYFYFDNKVEFGKMAIPPADYYTYVLGALFSFRLGLAGHRQHNWIGFHLLESANNKEINAKIGFHLILIGFIGYYARVYMPQSVANFFYLLGSLRFIGSIYLLFSNHPYRYWFITMVFIDYLITIIGGAMFYELLTWCIFFTIYLSYRSQYTFRTKLIGFAVAIFSMFVLQIVKTEYRKIVWGSQSTQSATKVFSDVLTQQLISEDSPDLSNKTNLEKFVSRMNLGWVVTEIMNHVSTHNLYTNGATIINDIPSVILPRFLFSSKKKVAGDDLRENFEFFTGRKLTKQTTINLSAFGDAYINFGIYGGWILIFLLGALLKWVIKRIIKIANTFPTVIYWLPLLFFDVIRMNDFYFLLNSLVKNSFIIVLFFYVYKKRLNSMEYQSCSNLKSGI